MVAFKNVLNCIKIFNLEQLSFADAIIAASGTVKLLPREFNEDEDEEEIERYRNHEKEFEPFRVQLGRIAQWSVSYDIASSSKTNIWIRTDFCWYRLGQPLEQYAEVPIVLIIFFFFRKHV